MRQVVLDTETTGLEWEEGHRIIEIGCVELNNRRLTRRHYHQYINPERDIDSGALEVHGITRDFLADKPTFSQVWEDFLAFVDGAELVIHNAAFDVAFIDHEMRLMGLKGESVLDRCGVVDSLGIARQKHPGQKNNLDALCRRYSVDNSQRELHGALLDAEILADVYLLLTGGQGTLGLSDQFEQHGTKKLVAGLLKKSEERRPLKVIRASEEEMAAHRQKLSILEKDSEQGCLWLEFET